MRVAKRKQLRLDPVHFMAEDEAHRKRRDPVEEVNCVDTGFDRGEFKTTFAEPPRLFARVPGVLPWHALFRSERSLRDAALGRICRDPAKHKLLNACGVGSTKERADVVHAADVVEKDDHRKLIDPGVGFGCLRRLEWDPFHTMTEYMVTLDGETLGIHHVLPVAREGEEAGLSVAAIDRMQQSASVVARLAEGDAPVYALNTGVGVLSDRRIDPAQLLQLQTNIVRSHCGGVGPPLSREVVRAMMLIRANTFAKGNSGIRPVIAQTLCDMLNRGVTPVVPSRGSVGASGDLAPLAHIAAVLIGEGEAEYRGRRLPGGEAMREAGVPTVQLGPKEGVALLNGTQLMLAIGCLELDAAEALADAADIACAMTVDALRGTPRAFDARLQEVRPHPGHARTADNLRRLLAGSEIRSSHLECSRVQDAYSLRCAPQVHGAVRDALSTAREVFEIELNSATDNPLVFGDEIISGGNFHGEPLAFQLDFLAIALSALAGISERRLDRLVNPLLNEDLPDFLADEPGLESGMMMLQISAASLVAENRVLATPASPGSLPTDGNKEDFVSMGATCALKLSDVVRNTRDVIAMELLAGARAVECLKPLRTGTLLQPFQERLRPLAGGRGDRPWSGAIEQVSEWIREGVFRLS